MPEPAEAHKGGVGYTMADPVHLLPIRSLTGDDSPYFRPTHPVDGSPGLIPHRHALFAQEFFDSAVPDHTSFSGATRIAFLVPDLRGTDQGLVDGDMVACSHRFCDLCVFGTNPYEQVVVGTVPEWRPMGCEPVVHSFRLPNWRPCNVLRTSRRTTHRMQATRQPKAVRQPTQTSGEWWNVPGLPDRVNSDRR